MTDASVREMIREDFVNKVYESWTGLADERGVIWQVNSVPILTLLLKCCKIWCCEVICEYDIVMVLGAYCGSICDLWMNQCNNIDTFFDKTLCDKTCRYFTRDIIFV